MRVLGLILCAVAVVNSGPVAQEDSVLRVVVGNLVNCMNSDISLCLKEHALKAADRLSSVRKLDIIDGVTLYNNGPSEARSLDSLPTDPEERNKQVTQLLWKSTANLFQKSELELSYGGGDDEDTKESRALDDASEGRGKKKKELKKKLKLLIPLAILGKIKAIILVVGALLVIAASVFKIALLAKIAFVAKVIAIIKALIAKKHSHEEHSYIPYEEHGHAPVANGWEGGSGWSRSRNEANGMAYSAYQN